MLPVHMLPNRGQGPLGASPRERRRSSGCTVAPIVVVSADVAHRDLPLGSLRGLVGQYAALEELDKHVFLLCPLSSRWPSMARIWRTRWCRTRGRKVVPSGRLAIRAHNGAGDVQEGPELVPAYVVLGLLVVETVLDAVLVEGSAIGP